VILAVVGDLASVAADAVVRPANGRLEAMNPASQHLDEAAGPKFVEQRRVRHELPPGAAVVTGAGQLPAEFVVHIVLGAAEDGVTTDTVRRAMEAALWQCTQWQIATLACPIPAAGNLTAAAAVGAMLEPIRTHMRNADHPATVLVVTDDETERLLVQERIGPEQS
jgi:O-acetyl-ADP-ribose deacetylase (regulator of RNase III)